MRVSCITLCTDFGLADPFVGIMKGVIAGIAPQARVIDISHQIPPQGVVEAGLCLKQSAPYFPAHTLHVCVVDPGVGSDRDIVLVRTPGAFFLAPDNGLLTYVLEGRRVLSANLVTNPHYFLTTVSRTFHGRDIFAPVAAHLFRGVNPHLFGPNAPSLRYLPALPQVQWEEGTARGKVLAVDRFGNLISNIPESAFHRKTISSVLCKGRVIPGLCSSYSAVEAGQLGALWESTGHLEIFTRNGNASNTLEARLGDEIAVTFR